MKRYLAIVILLATACGPDRFSTVEPDCTAIPEKESLLENLIMTRVTERVPEPDTALPVLSVRFCIDSTMADENARVSINRDGATITASDIRGLIYGAGKFLRSLRYTRSGIETRNGTYDFSPAAGYRSCYTARHHNNWYHWAGAGELTRYFEDMVLWGMNSFKYQMLYPGVNIAGADPKDVEWFETNSFILSERLKEMGVKLSASGGGNVTNDFMPSEYKATPLSPRRGNDRWNVCPSKPGATEYLIDYHLDRLRKLKEKDCDFGYLCFFPYDEGGCQCAECSPWGGNGYVKLIEKQFKADRELYPEARSIVSCWYFDEADWEAFYKYLETSGDWIDYLEIDAHGDFPRYPLEHRIPRDIPVVTFPEISMWGRFPWGGYGATALPGRFERLYRQVEDIAGGFRLYSEGLYEDINKAVVTGLYIDPSRHADDILDEYASYELPGVNLKDFRDFIHLLEQTHLCGEPDSTRKADFNPARFMREYPEEVLSERQARAQRAYELAMKLDSQILPSMKDCWRWQLLKCRAIIDREMFTARSIHTPAADECYEKLVKIYHCERQLRRMETEGLGGATCVPYLQPQVQ